MVTIPVGETGEQRSLNGRLRSKLGEMKITCVTEQDSGDSSIGPKSNEDGQSGPPGAGVMRLEQFRSRKQEAASILGEEKLVTPSSSSPRSQPARSELPAGGERIGLEVPRNSNGAIPGKSDVVTPGTAGSFDGDAQPYREMATALASVSMLATSRAGGYSVGRLEKDQLRFLSVAAGALRALLRAWPFFAPAWAACATVQLGLANYAEARVSSSLATLFGPETCEPWMSWVMCELQEVVSGGRPDREALMGSIPVRRAQVLGYLRQIEAIGVPEHLEDAWEELAAYARGICE